MLLAPHSTLFQAAGRAERELGTTRKIVELALSKRLRSERSRLAAAKLVAQYISFAENALPKPLPLVGADAVVTLCEFLQGLHCRGVTVPSSARYAIRVYAEALNLEIPFDAD